MSTEFFNDQWRIPSNENQNKISNYSMQFDGTSSYIDCGDSDKFSFGDGATDRPFSLSGWVKPNDLTKFRFINKWSGSLGYEYQFSTGTNDTLSFIINSLGTTSRIGIITSTLTSTDWQHWVATYDGTGSTTGTNSGMKIYINGVEVTTSDLNSGTYVAMQNTAAPLKIGTEDKNNYYANGKIDQVTIFDYELSPIQVASLGLDGYAFNFIPNDYINAGTGLGNSLGTYTGDASVSLWFKADTTTGNDGLFSMTAFDDVVFGNLRINIYNNELYFVSNGIGKYKTIPFTDTTSWHHLICVFKSGNITNSKIYLDGIDQTTTDVGTFPSSLSMTGLKTIIGAYHSINQVFQGKIDEVAIWNTALTAQEVLSIYNATETGKTADLNDLTTPPVKWYRMGD